MDKKETERIRYLMEKKELLSRILWDFENSYTWEFRKKIQLSIELLGDKIEELEDMKSADFKPSALTSHQEEK